MAANCVPVASMLTATMGMPCSKVLLVSRRESVVGFEELLASIIIMTGVAVVACSKHNAPESKPIHKRGRTSCCHRLMGGSWRLLYIVGAVAGSILAAAAAALPSPSASVDSAFKTTLPMQEQDAVAAVVVVAPIDNRASAPESREY